MINYNKKLCMTSPEAVFRMCSVKKLLLKLCRIHRKTPVWESLLNKVAGLQICNVNKKRLQYRRFLVIYAKILRALILKNIVNNYLLIISY